MTGWARSIAGTIGVFSVMFATTAATAAQKGAVGRTSTASRSLLDGPLREVMERGHMLRFSISSQGTLRPRLVSLSRGLISTTAARSGGALRSRGRPAPGPFVQVLLLGNPDEADLRELGIRVDTRAGGIRTARVPFAAIPRLAEVPGLTRAFLASPVHPLLDVSVPAVRADSVRGRQGNVWSGTTGRGVVVGIVDSGIDLSHGDFRNPDGSTRVLWEWEQGNPVGPAPRTASGDTLYGTEWTEAEINAGISTARDTVGHGTHVTGIAAGNGGGSDVDSLRYRYVGLAPEADLVIVDAILTDAGILDGVQYVFDKAQALGKPAVVNLSFGNQFGPHDGTGAVDRALSDLLGAGRLAVAAAGNAARDTLHAKLHVPSGGSDSVEVHVPPYLPSPLFNYFTVDAFYNEPDSLSFTLVAPNGTRLGPYFLADEQPDTLTGQGTVWLVHWDPDPSGSNLEIQVEVSNYNPENPDENAEAPAVGSWRVVVTDWNPGVGDGEVDLWLPMSYPFLPRWDADHYDPTEEIASPATARNVVAVGSFNTKRCWPTPQGSTRCSSLPPTLTEIGQVTYFSSHGPTRDGRHKPDLVAPGFLVSSSYSSQVAEEFRALYHTDSTVDPDGQHIVMAGTSASAPHVTGAVALWLEDHPSATPESVLVRFHNASVTDSFTGPTWNTAAGYGKLDVAAFLDPGLVPVRLKSLSVETTPNGHASLTWQTAESEPVSLFVLESRNGAGPWRERARFPGPGSHRWVDTESVTETRYRLWARLRTGVRELWAEEIWSPVSPAPRLVLEPAFPNPFRAGTRVGFRWYGNPEGPTSARVLDVAGRLVRTVPFTRTGQETGFVCWDGTDRVGRRARAGLYWIEVRVGRLKNSVELIRLR